MLIVIRSMRDLLFGQLMAVYEQSNLEHGKRRWPYESEGRQIALAEQDFIDYLRQCFFAHPGALICVWQAEGRYVCALRLEPWKDGLLLTGLETAPAQRGNGYAYDLVRAVQVYLAQQGTVRLYSHISKCNKASIAVHEKCGFQKLYDHAAYIDGSADMNAGTYIFEAEIS